MFVLLACMPLPLIHTAAVSLTNYHLIRRVQRQNRQLDELNRRDLFTGLASRGRWQAHASDPNLREWMDGADRALYRAKESGRNRVAGRAHRPAPLKSGHAADG